LMAKLSRGDIVMVSLDPTLGHEQSKQRPCLVVSDTGYNNRLGMIVVCPITSKVKGFPFEVSISSGSISGVVLVDQIRCVDARARNVTVVRGASADHSTMATVSGILEALLIA